MAPVGEAAGSWATAMPGFFPPEFAVFSLFFLLTIILLALCTDCGRHSFELRDSGEETGITQSNLIRVVKLEDALAARENPMINDIRKDERGASQIVNGTPVMTVGSPSPTTTVNNADQREVQNSIPEIHSLPDPVSVVEAHKPLKSVPLPVYSGDALEAPIVKSLESAEVPILGPVEASTLDFSNMSSLKPVEPTDVSIVSRVPDAPDGFGNRKLPVINSLEAVDGPNVAPACIPHCNDLDTQGAAIMNIPGSLAPVDELIGDSTIVTYPEPVDFSIVNQLPPVDTPVVDSLAPVDAPIMNRLKKDNATISDQLNVPTVNDIDQLNVPILNDIDLLNVPTMNETDLFNVPILYDSDPLGFAIMKDLDLLDAPVEFSSNFVAQLAENGCVAGEDQGPSLRLHPQHTYELIGELIPDVASVEVDPTTPSDQTKPEVIDESTTQPDVDASTVTEPVDLALRYYENTAELVQQSVATNNEPMTTGPGDGTDLTRKEEVKKSLSDMGWNPMYAKVSRNCPTPPPVPPPEDEE
ncbi:uncharacterized protein si:ch73-204p21.2 isoform X1 [Esox lucius]|uniref:uncharacterized protein si:ch73-204p21.2 isoform X1 n=1 Tax=Esox lucius TaxID=8010 RepID=UPI001476812D|nr:uncharacterized protein si:ch73-204p21.2 isoform X1 [Esox lucius]XP_010877021.2 uncharacterized protein si:ch73-204p21.2 isoform X1 [Esox lucius]XP_010877022.2 uncharacterized protein si:ch73-204p21.2 isoform X1 [Esox lucius]